MDKESRANYNKEYYLKNIDNFKLYTQKKIKCDCCNKEVSYFNYNKHIKTVKHLKNLNKKKNNTCVINSDEILDILKSFVTNFDQIEDYKIIKNKLNNIQNLLY
jgi:hypothetical protein